MAKIVSANCIGIISRSSYQDGADEQMKMISSYARVREMDVVHFIEVEGRTTFDVLEILSTYQVNALICTHLANLPYNMKSFDHLLAFISNLCNREITFSSIQDHLDSNDSFSSFAPRLIDAWLRMKKFRKIENAIASSFKAKSRNNRTGRKRIRNDQEISRLRNEGLTIAQISSTIGLSTTAVKRSLQERKLSFNRP